jgi:UDP-glucuronate 4-epimerase
MILVTGAAGFIGYHVAEKLLERGDTVLGIDNLNDYYDVGLKEARLARLQCQDRFQFVWMDIANREAMEDLFQHNPIDRVVHLAAQVGVRYSVTNPHAFVESNLVGFVNVLEGCRKAKVKHLVFASSSSVYGANTQIPFSVHETVDQPVSLYGATKRSNELMAYSYAHLYGLPCTGLRFFTTYGPWGRPDMALFLFTKAILEGRPIQLFNEGRMTRDFTYVDDIAEGLVRVLDQVPDRDSSEKAGNPGPASVGGPWRIYNIGNQEGVSLLHFIEVLEEALGRKAQKEWLPLQPGDMTDTCADITELEREVGFRPETPIEVGLPRFVDWYQGYYKPKPRAGRNIPKLICSIIG